MNFKEYRMPFFAILVVVVILAVPLLYLAINTMGKGQGGQIGRLEEEIKTNPSVNNYIDLSLAYINSGQPEKSFDPLRKAEAIAPGNPLIYNNLGVAYIMLKRFDEGIAACRRAIELAPNFQLAKNNLNWALSEKEKAAGK